MIETNAELTQREQEILQYREQKLSYKKIGEIYGITGSRASQIHHKAQRKMRKAERKTLVSLKNQRVVHTTFTRGQLLVIMEGLYALIHEKNESIVYTLEEIRKLHEEDRVYRKAYELIERINSVLHDDDVDGQE